MTLGWTILALIAGGIGVGVAVLLVRGVRPPRHSVDHRGDDRDRRDPPHKRATDFFASGTLPRWDP